MKKNKKIILLEDNRDVALYVRDVFRGYKYDIDHFLSPTGSFSVLDETDLIILDYHMPDMDGIEFLKFLHRNFPRIPVIMITGYGSESLCLEAFRLGIKDYLKKPFSPEELRAMVNRYIADNESGPGNESDIDKGTIAPDVINKLYRVKIYIDANLDKKIELNSVLKIAGMSKPSFNKYFKLVCGTTFKNYLLHKKIEKARYLLQQGYFSVTEIAYSLGFTDLPHFTRVFKKIEGFPPSHFSS